MGSDIWEQCFAGLTSINGWGISLPPTDDYYPHLHAYILGVESYRAVKTFNTGANCSEETASIAVEKVIDWCKRNSDYSSFDRSANETRKWKWKPSTWSEQFFRENWACITVTARVAEELGLWELEEVSCLTMAMEVREKGPANACFGSRQKH
ncbi:hypothetical protein Aperf_G00000124139 [Anoplocephala perfoliata]